MKKGTFEYHEPGTTVYFSYMKQTPSYVECDLCRGEGIIYRRDRSEVKCPQCKGEGKVEVGGGLKFAVGEGVVESFYFTIKRHITDEYYWVYHEIDGLSKSQTRVFSTPKEAQKQADEDNKKGIMGYTK